MIIQSIKLSVKHFGSVGQCRQTHLRVKQLQELCSASPACPNALVGIENAHQIHLIYLIYISMLVITKIYKSANATLHMKKIKPKKRKKAFFCVQGHPYFFKVEDIGGGVFDIVE